MMKGKKIQLVPLEKEDVARSRSWVNDAFLSSRILRALPVTQVEQEKRKSYQIWFGTTLISGTKRFRTLWTIR